LLLIYGGVENIEIVVDGNDGDDMVPPINRSTRSIGGSNREGAEGENFSRGRIVEVE
jgi:hypothetical protein